MSRYWPRFCHTAGVLGFALLLLIGFTPLVTTLHRWMSARPATGTADALVVLGAAVSPDGVLDEASLRRALAGVIALRAGRAPVVLFLGPRQGGSVEAEVRAQLARDLGVSPSAILTEARGLTTAMEAERSAERLLPERRRRIVLVSGEQHLWRAEGLFRRAGFEVLPLPVRELPEAPLRPDERLHVASHLTMEVAARLLYRVLGLV